MVVSGYGLPPQKMDQALARNGALASNGELDRGRQRLCQVSKEKR